MRNRVFLIGGRAGSSLPVRHQIEIYMCSENLVNILKNENKFLSTREVFFGGGCMLQEIICLLKLCHSVQELCFLAFSLISNYSRSPALET